MTNIETSTADPHVQVKVATLVTPSDPTPTHLLKLSALDSQLFLRFTIEYLLVYSFHDYVDRDVLTARLKSALARSLVPYYPLAGRVRVRPDASSLEVVCRAQGAVFLEATADFTVQDFEKAPHYVTEWRRLLALQVADVLKGAPPLVLQLTWLSDGAAALAVGFSHCICDGVGSVEFLRLFAQLATGRQNGAMLDFKPKPIWQRHLLNPTPLKQQRQTTQLHPEFNPVADHCKFTTRFTPDQLTPTSVTFDEWRINHLKNSVARTSQLRLLSLTSFEVLSAHIWRSWATALDFPPSQTLKLLFSIDIRNRVKPSLPTGYYGNAIVLGCAQTTAKEIRENGLAHATELIKEAKNRVDDDYVKEVVNSVSLNGASRVPDPVGVLILSQWSKLGLERIDFGLGRPVQVGSLCTDKYCILLPVHDLSRSVKVMLAVPSEAVDKYVHLLRAVG